MALTKVTGGTISTTSNYEVGVITATKFVGPFEGEVTGNADTATEATNVTVTANNSTDETVYPIFVDGPTGTQGVESDTGLSYNPSSGNLTATKFIGNVEATTIDVSGTLNYTNVTDIYSVGIITAASSVQIGAGLSVAGISTFVGIATFGSGVGIADSIFHTGDNNTAIRFPEDDNFTVECAGNERFRVKPTNDVAVFTGSNSGTLTIRNDTSNEMQIHSGSSDALILGSGGENERFRIASTGRVAIGNATNNASPTALLGVIADDGEADELYVGKFHNKEETAGHSFGVDIRAGSNADDHGLRVKNRANDATQFVVRGDGKVGINTTIPSDLLTIVHAANSDDGISIVNTNNAQASAIAQLELSGGDNAHARVQFECNGKYSTIRHDGNGHLWFNTNGSNERLRITSDGKVGIGSADPRGAIDLWGDGSSYPTLRLGTEDYQVDGEDIRFGRKDIGGSDIRYHSIHTRHDGVGGSGNYIHFKIHDAGGDPWTSQKTALKIDGLGRVAINNSTSQGDNKLTVKSDDASQSGANEGTVTGALAMFYGGQRTTSTDLALDTAAIHIKGQITDSGTSSSGTHETGKIVFSGRRRYGAQAWIVHETEWVYSTQQAGSHLKFYTAGLASNGGDESTPGVRLHINKEGKLRHGSALVSQVYGGGFSISHSGTTKRVTISGLVSGSVIFQYGTYTSAGQGQGGIAIHISGYQTANYTYEVEEIHRWSNGGGTGISISSVTKNSSNCTFDVTNSHGSYTAGGSWHVWGNDEVNVTVATV